MQDRKNWQVHFHIWLKHIKHDIEKGLYNQTYKWHNVTATTNSTGVTIKFVQGTQVEYASPAKLGSEEKNYTDNRLKNYLTVAGIKSTMTQESNGNNATIEKQETKNMNNQKFTAQNIANEAADTFKTVGKEITSSAITSAKMEAGENILLAMRNLVLERAGFFGKVKFKFMPVALDVAVTALADLVSVELMPNSNKAKLARECLNLAMTKEVISTLPLKQFTQAMTGGDALENVRTLIDANKND